MFEFIFWLSAFIVVYIYLGYPIVITLLAKLRPNPVSKAQIQPSITVIIPAFNEEDCIAGTIQNKLDQAYPAEQMEIIVVSDESTDNTDAIVEGFKDQGVKLIRQIPRQGKTAGVNKAVKQAKGEILIFADANSIYADDAIQKLVSNFSDENVGYVTGKMVYVNPDGSMVGDGCSAYMKYENKLREQETLLSSVVGVDGGVDAMRKSIHSKLSPDQLPDFVQPLKVVEQGYRVVYEEEALLKEHANDNADSEYRMRVRVTLRALWALGDMKQLFNPTEFGVFAFQLTSHKLLRYLAFMPLIVLLICSLVLANEHAIYLLALLAQIVLYVLAWKGHGSKNKDSLSKLVTLSYYFTLLNLSSAQAFMKYMKGEKQVIWKPREG